MKYPEDHMLFDNKAANPPFATEDLKAHFDKVRKMVKQWGQ